MGASLAGDRGARRAAASGPPSPDAAASVRRSVPMIRRCIAIAAALALGALVAPAGAAAASAADDRALALRLRPHLLFDSGERWRPLDVDRFLAEPGHLACPAGPGAVCTPLTSAAQLTPAVDHLDLRGEGPPDEPRTPSAIYARVTRDARRVAIDYWWFLRFNAYGFASHEGDWEGVTVIADRRGARVLTVHFAAHTDVWRYPAPVVQLDGRRVRVFVANGTHASYPRACLRRCRQTDGLVAETRFDGRRAWAGNTAAGCRGRCVRLLPVSADGAPAGWNAWRGRWGVTTAPAAAAPLTPSFQRRYQHPFAARSSPRDIF
jgi:hypothetical protein